MRQSTLFGRTLREAPADAQTPGHQLMLRAAVARQTAAGLYSWLPLGFRVAKKVEQIIREEMDRIGCQEMEMPVMTPAELWQETGRWDGMDAILFKLKDHGGRSFLVSYTHEEVVTHHARNEVLSYRQLPIMVYHFQSKGRDEARPRAGLLRVREFVMKDAYSLDADTDGLDRAYGLQHQAYVRIFQRMGLDAISVESDTGAMGGDVAHEFQVLTEAGDDKILICSSCDYRANNEKASRRIEHAPAAGGVPAPTELATPGTATIEALVGSLKLQASDFLKTVLVKGKGGEVVAVVLPGDREANEAKLRKLLDVGEIRFADDADFQRSGGVAGYVGPVGLKARIVVDTSVGERGYVSGANKKDAHLRDVVPGRDFQGERADVHDVREGDACPRCGGALTLRRGVEVGNIFKLGTYYSEKMGATFLAQDGTRKPFVMGSYGIGVGRAVQTIIETCRDERGIVWPFAVAPYEVHVVALPMSDATVRETAESLVATLEHEGVQVLFDDREESAGVKFADADLIGIPVRVTVSKRGLAAGTIEWKLRSESEARHIPRDGAARELGDTVRRMREAR
ncbi:MAG TPA: proline--tRNA ligase [Candidatus Limnocylindria bacterium]|nr:proline--tRNA ligase [Candidatus Limnocylindria bacterium]